MNQPVEGLVAHRFAANHACERARNFQRTAAVVAQIEHQVADAIGLELPKCPLQLRQTLLRHEGIEHQIAHLLAIGRHQGLAQQHRTFFHQLRRQAQIFGRATD